MTCKFVLSVMVASTERKSKLTVPALLEFKNAGLRRTVRKHDAAEKFCVEHWAFDKNGAERSMLTTHQQFETHFVQAMSRVGFTGSPKEHDANFFGQAAEPFSHGKRPDAPPHDIFVHGQEFGAEHDGAEKSFSSDAPPLPTDSPSSPPPIPDGGLPQSPSTMDLSAMEASLLELVNGSGDKGIEACLLADGEGGAQGAQRKEREQSAEGEAKTEFFKYLDEKIRRPQRGEWFHSYGVNSAVLKTLKTKLGVREHHIEMVQGNHNERPMMSFCQGVAPENNYIVLLMHELKLEEPESPAEAGAAVHRNQEDSAWSRKVRAERSVNRHGAIQFRSSNQIHSEVEAPYLQNPKEEDSLVLEEYQVVIFFFPFRNLLMSIGTLNDEHAMIQACREALLNRNSAVLCDLLDDPDGSDGCGTLMVVSDPEP